MAHEKKRFEKLFQQKVIILSLSLFLITTALILCFTLPSPLFFNEQASSKINIKDIVVWHIGDSNEVLNRLQQLGVKQTKSLEIQNFLSNDILESISLNQKSLVIFDGYWISERVNDPKIHTLLRKASYQKARLMAIGRSTSKFLESLDKAEVNKLG